ncbi:MAG TPA: hypothetical protein ENI11_06550 [Actinobacteria bacterium]|nr:hypothetical protein [Actinomycetota bacterium]
MKKINILISVVFAAALIGGAIFWQMNSGNGADSGTEKTDTQETESGHAQTPEESQKADKVEEIKLKPVGSFKGKGVAKRAFDGNKYTYEVKAELNDPPIGKFYEGWLVKGKTAFISFGKIDKVENEYFMEFTTGQGIGIYKEVVITEETIDDGFDSKPETRLLEGSFK